MNKKIISIVILCLVSSSGCKTIFSRKLLSTEKPSFVQSGKIIQKASLKRGGPLLIVPFLAGENIAATDELDRIAMKIVQGTASVLNEHRSPFTILASHNANTAELMLKGYVVKIEEPRGYRRWMFPRKKKVVGVRGELIDIKRDEVLLQFSHSFETEKDDKSFDSMGLVLGQDIGKFILSGVE